MAPDPESLRRRLHELGFDAVRFAQAGPAPGGAVLQAWVDEGHHADLHWMERTIEKRADPARVLTGARSLILLGVNYGEGRARERSDQPVWARYALHTDYHDTIKPGLMAAGGLLEELLGLGPEDYRYYVDTGPVLERGWAARAGIGFIGKNGMLISRDFGNWLFLAAILVRAELPPDPPLSRSASADLDFGAASPPLGGGAAVAERNEGAARPAGDGGAAWQEGPPAEAGGEAAGERTVGAAGAEEQGVGLLCGKCTRCLDACPTAALPRPGVVDARRCISYHTIENKGVIPRELRAGIGARIYGCDVCLEVCPWNRFAQQARSLLLEARPALADLTLREILELTPERFAARFRGTAIKRLKLRGLLRNACIVAANTLAHDCLDVLVRLASHPEPVVRAHAVWAVTRLGGKGLLPAAYAAESDPRVLDEYADALEDAPAPLKVPRGAGIGD